VLGQDLAPSVDITTKTIAPARRGNQPPSMNFNALAEKNAISMTKKNPVAPMHTKRL